MKRVLKILLTFFIIASLSFSSISATPSQNRTQSILEKGINYKIVDVYADGTEIVRGYRNTNSPSPLVSLDQAGHPLSGSTTALLGSDEILVAQWSSISYANFPGDLGFHTISYDPAKNFTESLDIGRTNDVSSNSDDNAPANIGYGDLDGNLRGDAVLAFYQDLNGDFNHQINIRVMESWGNSGWEEMGNNLNIPFGGEQEKNGVRLIPQVVTANLDSDPMSEFVVYGLDSGVATAWIFDDAAMSIEPRQFKYGDAVSIHTKNSHSSYMFSNGGSSISVQQMRGLRTAENEFRFTIVNPSNRSSTDDISYSAPISFMDSTGRFLNVDSSGNFGTVPDGNITDNMIFSFESSNIEFSTSGGLYENSFARIRSKTGLYVNGNFGSVGTATNSPSVSIYKVSSADRLPYNFDGSLKFLKKIIGIPEMKTSGATNYGFFQTQNLASGDVNGDGIDEFVITGLDGEGKGTAMLYNGMDSNFSLIHDFGGQIIDSTVTPDMADIDGDGINEVILATTDASGGTVVAWNGQTFNQKGSASGTTQKGYNPRLGSGDLDGDGSEEIYFVSDNTYLTSFKYSGTLNTLDTMELSKEEFGSYYGVFPSIGFGDVDKDGSKEFVLGYSDGESSYAMAIFNDTDGTGLQLERRFVGSSDSRLVTSIAVGDFNGDQFTLEYTGLHDQFQTPGEIAVVAAAPPNQAGISQNYASTGTTFGTSVSNSKSDGNEVSSSYGWYLNFQIKPTFFDVVEVGVEGSVAVTNEFTKTNTKTKTFTVTEEFTGGSNDDFVLYSTVIYDTYTYKVLDSPSGTMNGQNMTINVPRDPSMLLQTKEFYNKNNDDADYDIGTDILTHTPGYIPSYPTKDVLLSTIHTSPLTTKVKTVGQGGGSLGIQIDMSTEDTSGFSKSVSTEYTAGGSATVFGVGGGGGASWSSSETSIHEVSVGDNTAIRADVGSIDDSQDYKDFGYSFGMAFYSHSVQYLGRIMSFYVINYWVVIPTGWGGTGATTATEAKSAADEVNQIVVKLPFSSPLLILSSVLVVAFLRRKKE